MEGNEQVGYYSSCDSWVLSFVLVAWEVSQVAAMQRNYKEYSRFLGEELIQLL